MEQLTADSQASSQAGSGTTESIESTKQRVWITTKRSYPMMAKLVSEDKCLARLVGQAIETFGEIEILPKEEVTKYDQKIPEFTDERNSRRRSKRSRGNRNIEDSDPFFAS